MIKSILFKLKGLGVKRGLLLACILLLVVLIPTFSRLLRPGFYSMHDFHLFRLFEYDKCLADLQFPCRWAPDAALGYGQPVFNFYAQLPYVFGELFRFIGLSVVDATKAVFIMSLVLSAFTMFILAKQLWKSNLAAFLSALVYVYAPYRAVDVYVRGALPESLAFIFFPLITYFFNDYIMRRRVRSLLFFGMSFSLLILTHNLSALMYSFFLLFWGIYMMYTYKAWGTTFKFIGVSLLSLAMVAFYVLPVVAESSLISIGKTTEGYYDYRNHFVSLDQLLFSRFWGYGGSIWGDNDGMSFAIGHIQWILPLLLSLAILFRFVKIRGKALRDPSTQVLLMFLGIGVVMLFLTHYKSDMVWGVIKPIAFVQFPWRFLSPTLFCFSVVTGALVLFIKRDNIRLLSIMLITLGLIVLNAKFFSEDIWYDTNDNKEFSGDRFLFHASSAINDFWPLTAVKTPITMAPESLNFVEGTGSATVIKRASNEVEYQLAVDSPSTKVQAPIVYFPGWKGKLDDKDVQIYPSGELGLITVDVPKNNQDLKLKFVDTPIRTTGNYLSIFGVAVFASLLYKFKKQ